MSAPKRYQPSWRCQLALWINVAIFFALPFAIRFGQGTIWLWLYGLFAVVAYAWLSTIHARDRKAWHDALLANSPVPGKYYHRRRAEQAAKDKVA